MRRSILKYKNKLFNTLDTKKLSDEIETLYKNILLTWKSKKQIFICGNGGSAGNAIHIANDYLYGAGISNKNGLKIEALSANQAVITCLANDLGYEHIYSEQLKVKANKNDLLIILSGSGNSKNVINAIKMGNKIRMKTFAIVGFNGGKCIKLAKNKIHFNVNDMQISEDLQLIVMHMIMQELSKIKLK